MSFAFRLRVALPSSHVLISDESEHRIPANRLGVQVTIKPVGASTVQEASQLACRAGGFTSEDAARSAGETVRNALHLACAKHRVGIATGRDRAQLTLSTVARQEMERAGTEAAGEPVRVLTDVHGLQVYEEGGLCTFFGGSANGVVGARANAFLETLSSAIERTDALPSALQVALELFNSVSFESSPRARFLTLITCVEVLAKQRDRPQESIAYLDHLIAITANQELPEGEASRLTQALRQLQTESIASACVRVVTEQTSAEDGKQWTALHGLRHRLTHGGLGAHEVATHLPTLESLVQRVLLRTAGIM
jgi:hypothetical protein